MDVGNFAYVWNMQALAMQNIFHKKQKLSRTHLVLSKHRTKNPKPTILLESLLFRLITSNFPVM